MGEGVGEGFVVHGLELTAEFRMCCTIDVSYTYSVTGKLSRMKIAVSAQGNHPASVLDPRLGRARFLLLYDTEAKTWLGVENAPREHAAHGDGGGVKAAGRLRGLGADALISGHVCERAFAILAAAGLKMYRAGSVPAEEAVALWQRGQLSELTPSKEG